MMKKNRLRLATSPIAGLTTADMLQEAERRVVGRIFKDMANYCLMLAVWLEEI